MKLTKRQAAEALQAQIRERLGEPLWQALDEKEKMKCELCNDTGFYGDNGPGIKGNREYIPCECKQGDSPDRKRVIINLLAMEEAYMITCRQCKFWNKEKTLNGNNGFCSMLSAEEPPYESHLEVFDEYSEKIEWAEMVYHVWTLPNFGCMAGSNKAHAAFDEWLKKNHPSFFSSLCYMRIEFNNKKMGDN